MYRGSLAEFWGPPPYWHYGPVMHLVTLPLFAFERLEDAFLAWLFVNYIFSAGIIVLAAWLLDGGRPRLSTVSLVVIVTLNFNPFYEALTIRAIEVLELLLLLGAYVLHRKGRRFGSGIAIGVAAMAKFLPLIFLPYFVLKRNWRAFFGSLAVIVPIAIATQLVLGWQNSGIFGQLKEGSFLRVDENQSLSGMILRILDWTHAPLDGAMASRIAILTALAALSVLYLKTRMCTVAEDLEWWGLAVAMILLPPHNQNYYAIFLLPAYLALFDRYRKGRLRPSVMIVTLLSFLVVGLPAPLSVMSRLAGFDVWPAYLRAGGGFVGAALLAGVVVMLLLEECRDGLARPRPACRVQ
jgi:alpha-1,2-mannosyltransferase